MPVLVQNPSRRKGFRFRRLQSSLERLLADAGRADAILDVSLVTDRAMRRYNRTYRGEDRVTDVLAFPQWEGPRAPGEPARRLLGDVVIAVGVAARQARAHGLGLNAEVLRLAVHGALHLLGYDHQTPAETERMNALAARYVD